MLIARADSARVRRSLGGPARSDLPLEREPVCGPLDRPPDTGCPAWLYVLTLDLLSRTMRRNECRKAIAGSTTQEWPSIAFASTGIPIFAAPPNWAEIRGRVVPVCCAQQVSPTVMPTR
jgi:hypothetical protein